MALDLGTLGVRVEAQIGDSVNRLNAVKDSIENIEDSANGSSKSLGQLGKVDFSNLQGSLKNVKNVIENLSGKDVKLNLADNITEGISAAQSALDNFSAAKITSTLSGIGGTATGALASLLGYGLSLINPFTLAAAACVGAYQTASAWVEQVDADTQKMIENVKKVSGTADNTITNAVKSGLSTDDVQVYTLLAGITDTEWGTIEGGIKKIGTALADSDSQAYKDLAAACKELNVAMVDENKQPRLPADVFQDLVAAFQSLPAGAVTKDALAVKVFGRSYQDLLPLLNTDTKTFEASVERLRSLGAIINETDMAKLGGLNDALEWLSIAQEGTENAKAIRIAVDTTALTEAETMYQGLKTTVITDGYLISDVYKKAVDAYGTAYAAVSLTSKEMSDTEKYLDAMWNRDTSYAKSDAYFSNFDTDGDFYSLVAGAVYWIQGFGGELEVILYDILDKLHIYDVNMKDTADITTKEDGIVTYRDYGAGSDIGNAANGTDAWDTIDTYVETIRDGMMDVLGIEWDELSIQAQAAITNQLSHLEDDDYVDVEVVRKYITKALQAAWGGINGISDLADENEDGWYWSDDNNGYGVYGQNSNFRAGIIADTIIDSGIVDKAIAAAQAVTIPAVVEAVQPTETEVINGDKNAVKNEDNSTTNNYYTTYNSLGGVLGNLWNSLVGAGTN